jgi:hypothetical protein
MYFIRFSIVKLSLLFGRMFLYKENECFTSTEVIGIYFIKRFHLNLTYDN